MLVAFKFKADVLHPLHVFLIERSGCFRAGKRDKSVPLFKGEKKVCFGKPFCGWRAALVGSGGKTAVYC